MTEIAPNLYIGKGEELSFINKEQFRVVNVSKTVHYDLHDWKVGDDYSNDPNYLVDEREHIISINWIDGAKEYFDYKKQGLNTLQRILDFIDKNIKDYKVIIVCDKAKSRSPSIAMLYLAKRTNYLTNDFTIAKRDFTIKYPDYEPSRGILEFLEANWQLTS